MENTATLIQFLNDCRLCPACQLNGNTKSNEIFSLPKVRSCNCSLKGSVTEYLQKVFDFYCSQFINGDCWSDGDFGAFRSYVAIKKAESFTLTKPEKLHHWYHHLIEVEEKKIEALIEKISPFGKYHFPATIDEIKGSWINEIWFDEAYVESIENDLQQPVDENNYYISLAGTFSHFQGEMMNQYYELHSCQEKIKWLIEQLKAVDSTINLKQPGKVKKEYKLSRLDEACFCRLIHEANIIRRTEPNHKHFCERVYEQFGLTYAARIGNEYGYITVNPWPGKSIEKVKRLLLPLINDKTIVTKIETYLDTIQVR